MISLLKNRLDRSDTALVVIFFLFSLLFLVLLAPCHPYRGSFLIKAVPALSLALLTVKNIRTIQGKFVFLGLLFSAAGDVALDLDRDRYFLIGLSLFLAAHVFYMTAMTSDFRWKRSKLLPAAGIAAYSLTAAFFLRAVPGAMFFPVMGYLLVITAMAQSALFMDAKRKIILTGALVFMVSDTIIAVNKFIVPIPLSTLINIGTYFMAQFLIVAGFLQEKGLMRK